MPIEGLTSVGDGLHPVVRVGLTGTPVCHQPDSFL
jgi:hypothetical protein